VLEVGELMGTLFLERYYRGKNAVFGVKRIPVLLFYYKSHMGWCGREKELPRSVDEN
jgi:hypothetical protein